MAFQTVNGFDPAGGNNPVGSTGVLEFTTGTAVGSANLTKDFRDAYQPATWGMCAGVLAGGVCTASGLVITVPAGTYYYASQVWYASSSTTVNVPDNSTTYVWGCSDGVLRVTATSSPPIGFTRSQSCLLVLVTSVSGVCTLNLAIQDAARIADNTNRIVTEYNAQIGFGFVSEMDTVPAAAVITIPSGYQQTLFEPVVVSGSIICNGRLRVNS